MRPRPASFNREPWRGRMSGHAMTSALARGSRLNGSGLVSNESESLKPQLHAFLKMRRQLAVDEAADLLRMIARAEVRKDDQLVAEALGALNYIIQMHMAELVDLFTAVVRANETHFGNQDLRVIQRRITVQAGRTGIARVGQKRRPHLLRDR